MPSTTPNALHDDQAVRDLAAAHLSELLRSQGLSPRGVYRSGEVCRLLRVSRPTVLALCALAEHPDAHHRDRRALESFLVGSHRRITHGALVDWLARNLSFQRDAAT